MGLAGSLLRVGFWPTGLLPQHNGGHMGPITKKMRTEIIAAHQVRWRRNKGLFAVTSLDATRNGLCRVRAAPLQTHLPAVTSDRRGWKSRSGCWGHARPLATFADRASNLGSNCAPARVSRFQAFRRCKGIQEARQSFARQRGTTASYLPVRHATVSYCNLAYAKPNEDQLSMRCAVLALQLAPRTTTMPANGAAAALTEGPRAAQATVQQK